MGFKPAYTPAELELIRTWYPTEGSEGCIARGIKGRSLNAVKSQALSIGVKLTKEAARKRRQLGARERAAAMPEGKRVDAAARKWAPPEPRFASIFHAAQGVRV